ncbi:hypothetical protein EVAR_31241_1 [Eumeta japonica]|uniref:Uncharacterized protein n=1 Tax=Eumeta variegata TaxID=151549 RepID=A0A4C1VYJ0_EUMVA|nr:hypothetical protein EVAR_31241_1 [Eumeta japonica]
MSSHEKIDGCQRGERDMQRSYHVEIYSFCLPYWEMGGSLTNDDGDCSMWSSRPGADAFDLTYIKILIFQFAVA